MLLECHRGRLSARPAQFVGRCARIFLILDEHATAREPAKMNAAEFIEPRQPCQPTVKAPPSSEDVDAATRSTVAGKSPSARLLPRFDNCRAVV